MFTGIVDHYGTIGVLRQTDQGIYLQIECQFNGLALGESIAVNGICLTVVEQWDNGFSCELSPETLALTNSGEWQVGTVVNLERSLTLQSHLGGHFVMGHVDGTAIVDCIEAQGDFFAWRFTSLPQEAAMMLSRKGSVAVNGVSLTVNDVGDDSFTVMLIPHTLSRTNLHTLSEGDVVNIEYDYLARIVARQVSVLVQQNS